MAMFTGSLRLAADPESRVRAEIEVDDERLVVRTGGDELGNWALSSVTFDPAPGGFRMHADGEELILTTGDNPAFADLVGIPAPTDAIGNGSALDKKAPKKAPKLGAESSRFGTLRKRSAASWVSDDTLHPSIAYAITAAAILVIVGGALNWGDTRILGDDSLPWSRMLIGLAGVGAIVGSFLAWRREERMMGAGIAAGSGAFGLVILYFYASKAGLGLGFFIATVAVVPMTIAAVVGLTRWGIAPQPEKRS